MRLLKILLSLFLILSISSAKTQKKLNIGDKLPAFRVKNQFDKEMLVKNMRYIVIAFTREDNDMLHHFLLTHKGLLKDRNIVYIADISGMPSAITKIFALPKMKKYSYPITLIYDRNKNFFQHKRKRVTLYSFEKDVVTNIYFITDPAELMKYTK